MPVLLRALLAAIFAIVSTVHAPVMAMVRGEGPAEVRHMGHFQAAEQSTASSHDDSTHHADTGRHDGHHCKTAHSDVGLQDHQASPNNVLHDATNAAPGVPNICFDCCTAVAPPAIVAPALFAVPLTTLKPRPPKTASPFVPQRDHPPPRLHV